MRMLLSWFAGIFDAIRERGAEETRQTDPHYHWLREQQEAARAAVDTMQRDSQDFAETLSNRRSWREDAP